MNEPIQHATKTTGTVTARMLLNAIKQGPDSTYIHGNAAHGRESYSDSYVFTVSAVKKSRDSKQETTTKIDVPGWVSNGSTSARRESGVGRDRHVSFEGTHRPLAGFWSFYGARDAIVDVLEVLPPTAEVAFHVYLDAGTQEYLVRAECAMNYETYSGLHSDHIYLVATYTQRGRTVTRRFLLDTSTTPHNTARFGVSR